MDRHQIKPDNALAQMLAGKSIFTIEHPSTGTRFTYRIEAPAANNKKYSKDMRFIKVFTGNDNENSRHYTYFAHLRVIASPVHQSRLTFTYKWANGKIGRTAPSIQMFEFVIASLRQGTMPADYTIWHEGKCCKCGRKLTVPTSIASGIGPECAKFVSTLHF